ncbi:MAG TPA: MarR family transcriptional regulator [Vicinamibacterales bacterium]|nr:MarR family transcriptional regulator [Vicinamibacterales bacterium]
MTVSAKHAPAGLFSLLRAAGTIESHVDTQLAPLGLSLPKLAALQRLVAAGNALPLGQLAERLACVKSNVTQLVDRLEAEGLVERAADPDDRRSRLAVITPAGRARYEEGILVQQRAERELFGTLTDAEAHQFAEVIAKLERKSR